MSSFFDKAKGWADKAREAAGQNSDRIRQGVDRAAGMVDERTKGKYADKVGKARDAAHKGVDKLAEDRGQGADRRDEGPATGRDQGPDAPR